MRKLLLFISIALLSSCVTQKKVNAWLNDHPTVAAGYCADKFPPDTTTRVITGTVDTASYAAAYNNMATYADSLFTQLQIQRNAFKPTAERPCPPQVNIDSLRKAVDMEIRKRLVPCKDSIKTVVYTVVDKAREKQLQGKLDEKDGTITARDTRITELEGKVKALRKWAWLFWGLIAAIVVYTLIKLRFKLPI